MCTKLYTDIGTVCSLLTAATSYLFCNSNWTYLIGFFVKLSNWKIKMAVAFSGGTNIWVEKNFFVLIFSNCFHTILDNLKSNLLFDEKILSIFDKEFL